MTILVQPNRFIHNFYKSKYTYQIFRRKHIDPSEKTKKNRKLQLNLLYAMKERNLTHQSAKQLGTQMRIVKYSI